MSEPIVIRAAVPADADAIDGLVRTAFSGSDHGHQGEAELVRMIEADGDAVISMVADRGGAIIGHALFSHMDAEAEGAPISAAGLAPVAVDPAFQGQGIGDALIRAGLDGLRDLHARMSFVLGDPAYYPRFGYSALLAERFASPFAGPYFMAMMLDSGADWPLGGRADYAPAFSRMG